MAGQSLTELHFTMETDEEIKEEIFLILFFFAFFLREKKAANGRRKKLWREKFDIQSLPLVRYAKKRKLLCKLKRETKREKKLEQRFGPKKKEERNQNEKWNYSIISHHQQQRAFHTFLFFGCKEASYVHTHTLGSREKPFLRWIWWIFLFRPIFFFHS